LSAATVTFEPGARTPWRTHPLDRTLLVVSRFGRVRHEGCPIEEIRPATLSVSLLTRNIGMAQRLNAPCRTSPSLR
jgi:hypothetical protein